MTVLEALTFDSLSHCPGPHQVVRKARLELQDLFDKALKKPEFCLNALAQIERSTSLFETDFEESIHLMNASLFVSVHFKAWAIARNILLSPAKEKLSLGNIVYSCWEAMNDNQAPVVKTIIDNFTPILRKRDLEVAILFIHPGLNPAAKSLDVPVYKESI